MTDTPYTAAEIFQLHEEWADKQNKLSQAKDLESDRLGVFRGGNVGCIGSKREIYGTCPRRTLARSWGFNGEELKMDTHLMFDGGKVNEIACDNLFNDMLGKDSIIPEGDPRSVVSWTLPDGRRIGGSPDAILQPKGKLLLEYKRISSPWTARKVSVKKTPKKEHIIQAAHYMGVSGLSHGVLYYRQDVNFSCPTMGKIPAEKMWPEVPGIVIYENDYPMRVRPHVSLFDLLIDNTGLLWIRHHTQEDYRPTVITTQGIYNFYQLCSDQETKKFLGDKPSRKYPTEKAGDSGDSKSACGYCPLADICGNEAINYDYFKDEVTKLIRK